VQHQFAHRHEQRARRAARPFLRHDALDENRAKSQLAKKAGVDVTAVSNLAIWGNHSATMYPDFYNAKISGQPGAAVIKDEAWLKGEFITTVQQRGAAIIKARGLSSAASAANAAVNTVYKLTHPTPAGDWFSVGVHSDGSYGIEKGLMRLPFPESPAFAGAAIHPPSAIVPGLPARWHNHLNSRWPRPGPKDFWRRDCRN
jgi:malate/lactate dehydrogenase